MDISGTVCVITGGASGIGAAAATDLAAHGARVVLGDLDDHGLTRTADVIRAGGGEVATLLTDVTDETQVAALMDLALERYGAIQVVLPSAGVFRDAFTVRVKLGKVAKVMSSDDFRKVIDVNLTGTFLTLREALTRMIDGDQRGVLFTVSSINKTGELGQINYAASKTAVALWPKLLAGELHAQGIDGIRVVGLAPGYVETPILQGMREEVLDRLLEQVPIGRLIHPAEVAALIRHVIENEAIHATTLEIAGGAVGRGMPK